MTTDTKSIDTIASAAISGPGVYARQARAAIDDFLATQAGDARHEQAWHSLVDAVAPFDQPSDVGLAVAEACLWLERERRASAEADRERLVERLRATAPSTVLTHSDGREVRLCVDPDSSIAVRGPHRAEETDDLLAAWPRGVAHARALADAIRGRH